MRSTTIGTVNAGASETWLPLPIGQVVDGKYRLERVLGRGGMGVVVQARHLTLGHTVAIKFVNAERTDISNMAERLKREAVSAAQLRNPYVIRTLDFGQLGQGAVYLILEHLQGESLADRVKRLGPLDARTTRTLVTQACCAIGEAHALGILHRDLTPNNLFYTELPDGQPFLRVLDFGLAKSYTHTNSFETTNTKALLGSPPYMSPEQIRHGSCVDARTDVWALGVVAFYLLTALLPFDGGSPADTFVAILSAPPHPFPPELEVPDVLKNVVARCLRKDPTERFQSALQVATALSPDAAHRASLSLGGESDETVELAPGDWRK